MNPDPIIISSDYLVEFVDDVNQPEEAESEEIILPPPGVPASGSEPAA